MLPFRRHPANPILPAVPGTWMESQTANPDLLLRGETCFLYFRGQQGGHDRIGLATCPIIGFNGVHWDVRPDPVLDVGPPGSWDETHVLDPATVEVDGRIFLYYSAVSSFCPRSVCLATSEDGIQFTRHAGNPIVVGGGPEVVFHEGRFYLFFWKERPGRSGFELHLATFADGFHFQPYQPDPILSAGREGAWDSHTVETPRITRDGDRWVLFYCGSDRHDDYPFHAGIAFSKDLVHWEKDPHNPVFSRGLPGEWDEGAIWFTTVEKMKGGWYLFYEGYGGGTARSEPYGTYLTEARSQVGLAILQGPLPEGPSSP